MIIIFVIVLFFLLGFAALGIDVGYMYSVRNDLQRSVDSGALAGAFALHDGGWVSGPLPPAPVETKARDRARYFATRDPVGGMPLDNGAITVGFPAVNRIQVTAQDNVNLFFAGVLGVPAVLLSATATGLAEPVDQNVECLTPLAFPYPYVDNILFPNNNWDPGEPVFDSCNPADRINTLCQGGGWGVPGGTLTSLQVANTPPSGNPATEWGDIFPLYICGDNSDSDLTRRIRTPCWDGCNAISINDLVTPKPHPTYMPTINEINSSLIGGDPGASWDSGSNLPVSLDPNYSGDNWLLSPRVMRVMLYDPRDGPIGGRIRIRRFAAFWVLNASNPPDVSNRFVMGYLVPDSAVGDTSGSPLLIEPSLKTTRLVQ